MAKKAQAGFLSLPHILSKLGIPSSPSLNLRILALRQQRARWERWTGPSALGTGTWS